MRQSVLHAIARRSDALIQRQSLLQSQLLRPNKGNRVCLRSLRFSATFFLAALSLPIAHGQTITTTPLATSAVPVNDVGSLILLTLALAVGVYFAARSQRSRPTSMPRSAWGVAGAVLVLGALVTWGDGARAQLAELQRFFNSPAGETLPIPVQASATAPDGSPSGVLPVVYTNQANTNLLVSALSPASWQSCFPLGAPAVLPTSVPRSGALCTVGRMLEPGAACWVDVAQICAAAVATVRGSQPSVLQADTASVNAGALVSGNVLTNDADADGPLQVTRFVLQGTTYAAGTTAGALTVQSDGAFRFSPANPYTGSNPLVVTYVVQTGASSTLSITINRPPVANNDTATTNAGTPITIAVRANDTDADNDPLTVTGVTQGTSGSVVIDPVSGNPTYTPNAGFAGADAFTYTISDGRGGASTATVNVTVNVVILNTAPVARNDTATTNAGVPVTVAVRANDTDADSDPLTVSSITQGTTGSVVIDAITGNPIYTPNAGFTGSDSFTYTISDSRGGASTATVNVTVNVVIVNTAPVARNDTATTNAGAPVTVAVRANDTDADNDPLTVTSVTQGTNGSVVIDAITGNPIYTPNAGFAGADAFTYTISDGRGGTSTATVNITVNVVIVNTAPVARNDTATTNAGVPVTVAVRANDTDADNDPLTLTGVTQGASGSVVIDAITGNPIYTPNAGFAGTDAFTYTISDGRGGTSTATVNVTVNVVIVNTAPVANNDTATTNAGTPITIAVRGNDTDADTDPLTVTGVTQGNNGSVVIDAITGNPIYTPNVGFAGADAFTYTISDGRGGASTATVNITVNVVVVNSPPVANNDTVSASFNIATVIASATLLSNDTDADSDTLVVQSVQSAVNGTVSLLAGNITFTPTANFEGVASFTYTITDGRGGTSTATVTVNVAGVASAPSVVVLRTLVVIAQGTGGASERFPVTTALVDTDGSESLSIRISGVPTGVSFNAGTNLGGGVWTFTPSDLPNLQLNVPGSYTTTATSLTVQVISTEANGGATASTSVTVRLIAAYTTVTATTTTSGNYTGGSANEFIQGGSGNNTINAGAGNNIVHGFDGNDTLTAGSGSDVLDGGSGDDTLQGGSGNDVLIGGPGRDTLDGGGGDNAVDVFVWRLGDQGGTGAPVEDTINNFGTAAAGNNGTGGDVLDLRDLLQGEAVGPANGAGNLANHLHFEISGGSTIIHVSHTGGFAGDSHTVGGSFNASTSTQRILLSGVDLQSLYSGATTDRQIITQLLNNHKLIVN